MADGDGIDDLRLAAGADVGRAVGWVELPVVVLPREVCHEADLGDDVVALQAFHPDALSEADRDV